MLEYVINVIHVINEKSGIVINLNTRLNVSAEIYFFYLKSHCDRRDYDILLLCW